jgi:hypothetical protein
VSGSYKYSNKPFDSIKYRKFPDQQNNCFLVSKDCSMKSVKRLCLLNSMRNVGNLCQRIKIMTAPQKKRVSV